jgi:hypothetical protein
MWPVLLLGAATGIISFQWTDSVSKAAKAGAIAAGVGSILSGLYQPIKVLNGGTVSHLTITGPAILNLAGPLLSYFAYGYVQEEFKKEEELEALNLKRGIDSLDLHAVDMLKKGVGSIGKNLISFAPLYCALTVAVGNPLVMMAGCVFAGCVKTYKKRYDEGKTWREAIFNSDNAQLLIYASLLTFVAPIAVSSVPFAVLTISAVGVGLWSHLKTKNYEKSIIPMELEDATLRDELRRKLPDTPPGTTGDSAAALLYLGELKHINPSLGLVIPMFAARACAKYKTTSPNAGITVAAKITELTDYERCSDNIFGKITNNAALLPDESQVLRFLSDQNAGILVMTAGGAGDNLLNQISAVAVATRTVEQKVMFDLLTNLRNGIPFTKEQDKFLDLMNKAYNAGAAPVLHADDVAEVNRIAAKRTLHAQCTTGGVTNTLFLGCNTLKDSSFDTLMKVLRNIPGQPPVSTNQENKMRKIFNNLEIRSDEAQKEATAARANQRS